MITLLMDQIICSQWSNIIGYYDGTYVYVMENSKLPLYVPSFNSQCIGHSGVEYFLGNIDIYVLLFSYHPQVALLKSLLNDSVSSTRWLGMVSVGLCYNLPQNFLCSLLLGKSLQASLQSEVSPDPLNSLSLCLVSGHISDLALELSFSMADRVLPYL